ncbi:CMGC kinase, MAPK family (ERK) MAPK-1 [Cardiosporidium cionae]|uniref:Mitogen-activated protein kinase n=1 Tax=Cardiosporidium cionae TaxID=476202 RepID=A0ABQ7J4P2_9APIC|nr:CMGC kinase, MAPK family (ERK) MAPK-1 [Cardiosporidium cionae]|eukprot:KAF8818751.1 CMGC kinase, MAPK family (ERK) MAPK-1 [Cardiosporidium cionae]
MYHAKPSIFNAKPSSNYFLEAIEHVYVDENTVWEVPKRLKLIQKVGSGAYGIVASFFDEETKREVAVKKVGDAFKDLVDAKRILREIRILRHLKHTNIIRILDIFPPSTPDFEDIYLVSELMSTDLHRVLHSRQKLTDGHFQYFIYQILRGLLYLHSANVIHRDLKPCNILINLNCELKICDFGLARGLENRNLSTCEEHLNENCVDCSERGMHQKGTNGNSRTQSQRNAVCTRRPSVLIPKKSPSETTYAELTDYVVTRWYRSPEIILHPRHYDKPIDVWSLGCIFAELLGRQPLFAGSDNHDQLRRIVGTLGTPNMEDLQWLPTGADREKAIKMLQSYPQSKGQSFHNLFPHTNPLSIDLLQRMLTFNPEERITVEEALEHEYFEGIRSFDEPRCPNLIDWSFDNFKPTKRILQNRVYEEMAYYNPGIIFRDWNLLPICGIERDVLSVLQQLYLEQKTKQPGEDLWSRRYRIFTALSHSSMLSNIMQSNDTGYGYAASLKGRQMFLKHACGTTENNIYSIPGSKNCKVIPREDYNFSPAGTIHSSAITGYNDKSFGQKRLSMYSKLKPSDTEIGGEIPDHRSGRQSRCYSAKGCRVKCSGCKQELVEQSTYLASSMNNRCSHCNTCCKRNDNRRV